MPSGHCKGTAELINALGMMVSQALLQDITLLPALLQDYHAEFTSASHLPHRAGCQTAIPAASPARSAH